MKSLPTRGSRSFPTIEPLEARIAPAVIFIGDARETTPPASDTPLDTEYRELNITSAQQILFTDTSSATDAISAAVDSPVTNNTFFLRLSVGDQVQAFTNAGSYQELITVNKGHAIAFFVDYNENNNFDAGEFTGLALGKDAVVNVASNVRGDIVTNLNEQNTATTADDTLSTTSLVSPSQGIERISVTGGSIFGDVTADGTVQYASVLSGGSISAVLINGTVGNILAGRAADGATFDFFPDRTGAGPGGTVQVQPGGNGTISFSVAPGQVGASISNVNLDALRDRLEAGAGGAGAPGGDVSGVQITTDTDGFSVLAGAGGPAGVAGGKPRGGAGGNVSDIVVAGLSDDSPNSARPVVVSGGQGGDSSSAGKGGSGGSANRVFVGFEINNGNLINSGDLLADSVLITAGAGGDGKSAGRGGSLDALKVRVQTSDVDGVEEISVIAGKGGNNVGAGGKAGAGGSITNAVLQNQILTFGSDILVSAGDGGATSGTSKGAKGGVIKETSVLGFDVRVLAGDGSSGTRGGNGGSIEGLQFVRDDEILTHNAVVDAGRGGNSTAGKAGKGGNLLGVRSLSVDLSSFDLNSGTQGDGGTSSGGKGGAGGKVSGLSLFDTDTGQLLRGTLSVRTGDGGAGSGGGGKGGLLSDANISTLNANIAVTVGSGGDSTGNGKGGKGGGIASTQLTADGIVPDPADPSQTLFVSGSIVSGSGGNSNGAGGSGGSVKLVNMNVDGSGTLIAGKGGNGQGGAAGSGGSVLTSGVFATNGAGILRAGDAGTSGSGPGRGGSIVGTGSIGSVSPEGGKLSGLRAALSLTIEAGDGTSGGRGGSILGIAYGSTSDSLTPTPSGDIILQAGNGSAGAGAAGRGGALANIFGSVSSGAGSVTSFRAGDGGASSQRSAGGGSISNVFLTLGGGPDVLLTMQAGDAGDTSGGAKGAKGGSVRTIGVTDLASETNLRSIAAGNGGDAGGVGGRGGSVVNTFVQDHDIGVRTGETFGFSTMGGIFAGVGGNAARDGVNGSVSGITANAIASIVAGRAEAGGPAPRLVKRVDHIILNDDRLLLERNGAFLPDGSFDPAYYATANLVGAIHSLVKTPLDDPRVFDFTEVNGTPGFQLGDRPIDGILMAEVIDERTINFIPEARLSLNPATGQQEFFDSDNRL